MTFREATNTDEAAILTLLRQIAAVAGEPDYGPDCGDEKLLEVIDQCRTAVLETGGGIVGLCAVRLIDLPPRGSAPACRLAFVMAFGIDHDARRRGHGTAMFAHMRDWLRNEGADLISLNVSARNHAARAFYGRMGLAEGSIQMEMPLGGRRTGAD